MGLTLGMNLKFYTSVAKGLKLKVRKFWGLIATFVEVTEEKLSGRGGGLFGAPILQHSNKTVNIFILKTNIFYFAKYISKSTYFIVSCTH